MKLLSDLECIIAVLLGSWLAIARKMGRSGNVEAIRGWRWKWKWKWKCWVLLTWVWIDGNIDGHGEWKCRRKCISIILELKCDYIIHR